MIHSDFYTPNHRAYLEYYTNQAGGLPRFQGGQQYGYGLGALLRGLFRRIVPLGRQVFEIAKPHLKEAGRDLTKAAVAKVTERLLDPKPQRGSGRKRKQKTLYLPDSAKKRRVSAKRSKTDIIPEIF